MKNKHFLKIGALYFYGNKKANSLDVNALVNIPLGLCSGWVVLKIYEVVKEKKTV